MEEHKNAKVVSSRKKGSCNLKLHHVTDEMLVLHCYALFFPKQVYLWGSILEKNRLDALVGALGLVGRGFGCAGRAAWGWAWCWARWAGLGVDLAVLGALRGVGRGVGRAGLGWAWIWLCWARCVGLGVVLGALGWVGRGFGCAGRAAWGWAWCWARWAGLGVDLAVLGALRGVGRGVGRAGLGWAGWAWCWARWAGLGVDLAVLVGLGWAWGLAVLGALAWRWAWSLAVLGALGWVGRGVWPCWARWLGWAWFQSTKVYSRSTKIHFPITQSIFTST